MGFAPEDRLNAVSSFLREHEWVAEPFDVAFLAAGEYNENYLVESDAGSSVFRINHGTQLGIHDQIRYEFDVLSAVHASGATPRPLELAHTDARFPRGVLLMEYFSGGQFSYERDYEDAAELFAAIHALPAPEDLIHQPTPVADILSESRGLLSRFPEHPLASTGEMLTEYASRVEELGRKNDALMRNSRQCIVNTEVNSSNFVAQVGPGDELKLVDWEKAVVSSRYQDIGHFLVPTTTLWKSDYVFQPETRRRFLERYRNAAGLPESLDELDHLTSVMEKTIVLRALSWCYMAYYEYTKTKREPTNPHSYGKINALLSRAQEFTG